MNNSKLISRTRILVVLFLLGISPSFAQQNIQFTQYIFNSLSVNPAYAGYKENWFAQMALRNQWTGIADAPKTGQISIDGILDRDTKKMGLGLQISADKLGPQSSTTAYLNYAYRLRLDDEDKSRLAFGIGAGINQYSINYGKLTPIDDGDLSATQGETNGIVPNVRIGAYYYSPKWYLGLSLLDLLNSAAQSKNLSNQGFILNKRHVYFISGMLFDNNEDLKFRPSILVKDDFKGPTSLDLNVMTIFKDKLWLGGSYRTGVKLWSKSFEQAQPISSANSLAGVIQFFISDAVRVGYSYDYTTSRLSSIENGSHEITLGITFEKKSKLLLTPRYF